MSWLSLLSILLYCRERRRRREEKWKKKTAFKVTKKLARFGFLPPPSTPIVSGALRQNNPARLHNRVYKADKTIDLIGQTLSPDSNVLF
jgi:hypothetical protein